MNKRMKVLERRKRRVRKKLIAVNAAGKYRISVVKSSRNMHVQLINDVQGVTLVAASTIDSDCMAMLGGIKNRRNKKSASVLGKVFANRISGIDLSKGVFLDRGSRKYCGAIKEFADTVRSSGVNF